MAISREDISEIAKSSADKVIPEKCRTICTLAGITYAQSIARDVKYAPTVTPMGVAGLVKEIDLVVPHSELAMHIGAAGRKLIAWAVREDGRYAHIIYEDGDGCCAYTHGLPWEVLNPELLRVTKDILHIKEG